MVPNQGGHLRKGGMLSDHVCPDIGVPSHDFPFRLGQWAGLIQNVVAYADFPQIVERASSSNQLDIAIAKLEAFSEVSCKLSNTNGM